MADNYFYLEENRLKTFNGKWPHPFISIHTLAKTGFIYSGTGDQVECHFCGVKVNSWEIDDNEITEHFRWSPTCPLINRRHTRNVPIGQASELTELLNRAGEEARNILRLNRKIAYTETPFNDDRTLNQPPDYPQFASDIIRMETYNEWLATMEKKPKQMSEAGFFHTQKDDRVICFTCGGGLSNWSKYDDPWEQHAIWYPKCGYLIEKKGQNYIDQIREKISKRGWH